MGAWQPFTGRGIAAFAGASNGRIGCCQALAALMFSVVVVQSLRTAWEPLLESALRQLPTTGAQLESGVLQWPDTNVVLLASSPQWAWIVDPLASGSLGNHADVQLELGRREFRIRGVLGHLSAPYAPDLSLPLDQSGATATWGAWRIPVYSMVWVNLFLACFLATWLLANLHAPLVWTAAWLGRRPLTYAGAWRLATAALIPATVILTGTLALYARSWIRMPGLMGGCGLSVLVGLGWTAWGTWALPATPLPPVDRNPFRTEARTVKSGGARRANSNPFNT